MHRPFLIAFGLLLGAAAWATARQNAVPPERLAHLSRGVNIPHWLAIAGDYSREATDRYITGADLKLIKDAGLTHVRLPIAPEFVWDGSSLRADGVARVKDAIQLILQADLSVVVDPHATGPDWARPDEATGRADELERFWSGLAPALADTDANRVFLEVRNEPADIKDQTLWCRAQGEVVKIIRAGAPRHTIIATGDEWANPEGLARLTPYEDTNVVYTFHFYGPHTFTHQGATWGAPHWKAIRGLPYPSSPEVAGPVAVTVGDPRARGAILEYGRERWDAARVRAEIAKAAAWSTEHAVPIYCGEFGVYRKVAPVESRLAWLRDTTGALDGLHIGWAMWDYSGGFALTEGGAGERRLDARTVEAIGPPR